MYGTLTAPLLWYTLFSKTLLDKDFEINPYNNCVANKIMNGHQFTICWYVDGIKFSHKDKSVVHKKFDKMEIVHGNKQTYFGIELQIVDKKVNMSMKQYLQDCIEDFPKEITNLAKMPATKSLTRLSEVPEPLDDHKRKIFHSILQKLLHVAKQARLDLQVAIGFLCTRARNPNKDDWRKLKYVLQYIHGTIDLKRILSIDSFIDMNILVDASHACHDNMRGQTGGCISMGYGVLQARSSKQNLNSKSSTETELIGNSNYLTYALWYMYFFHAQGYRTKHCYKTMKARSNSLTMARNPAENKLATLTYNIFGYPIG